MRKAEELKERIPIPGERRDRWIRLKEDSERSFSAVREFEALMEDQDERFIRACETEDIKHISFVGVKLDKQLQKMMREKHRWSPDQLNSIPPKIDKVRQAVIHFFDPWLKQQTILKSQQVEKFRHKMLDQVGSNLQTLKLPDLYKKQNDMSVKRSPELKNLKKSPLLLMRHAHFLTVISLIQTPKSRS